MVEMEETATILNNATYQSLVLMDEVGRGTSGEEGSSIAQSIVEYLCEKIKNRLHYFQPITLKLQILLKSFLTLKIFALMLKEKNGQIISYIMQKQGNNLNHSE